MGSAHKCCFRLFGTDQPMGMAPHGQCGGAPHSPCWLPLMMASTSCLISLTHVHNNHALLEDDHSMCGEWLLCGHLCGHLCDNNNVCDELPEYCDDLNILGTTPGPAHDAKPTPSAPGAAVPPPMNKKKGETPPVSPPCNTTPILEGGQGRVVACDVCHQLLPKPPNNYHHGSEVHEGLHRFITL